MPLRLLADENIPAPTIEALRRDGHDVASVSENTPGVLDEFNLTVGERQGRILLTFDEGIGALIFADGVPQTTGVILLRLSSQRHGYVTPIVIEALRGPPVWEGNFTVVDEDGVRPTLLPDLEK